MKSPYTYAVDVASNCRNFEVAALLAVLRSTSDNGKPHMIDVKSARTYNLVSQIPISATLQTPAWERGEPLRVFNFTAYCGGGYKTDGQKFKHLDAACARAVTRAEATRSTRTVTGFSTSKEPVIIISIQVPNH